MFICAGDCFSCFVLCLLIALRFVCFIVGVSCGLVVCLGDGVACVFEWVSSLVFVLW